MAAALRAAAIVVLCLPVSGSDPTSAPAGAAGWRSCGASTSSRCCRSTAPSSTSGPHIVDRPSLASPLACWRPGRRTEPHCCSTCSSLTLPARTAAADDPSRRKGRVREQHVGRAGRTFRRRFLLTVSRRSPHPRSPSRTVDGFNTASLDLRGHARRRLADPSHVRTSFLCGSAGPLRAAYRRHRK